MSIIEILTWVSLISGGILVLLMVISLVAGMDWDIEVGDGDADSGGIGLVKGGLMFISMSSWIVKAILATDSPIFVAIGGGLLAGIVSVLLLSWVFNLLLKNQHNVNWSPEDAIGKTAKVYLKVPSAGNGIIKVKINGSFKELKAKTRDNKDIPTGAEVFINDFAEDHAYISVL